MSEERQFDVIVYGATGFTGRLVAEYIAKKKELDVARWAIAGRNTSKLEDVRRTLVAIDPTFEALTIVKASADDAASLLSMAASTKVVLTTVGPYIRYGEPLVEACVEAGTNYVDITGEPEFVDGIEDRFHEAAVEKRIKIVNCCGFDSIPHDLGVLYTINELVPKGAVEIEGFVWSKGTFSGGTWNSAIDAFERFKKHRKSRSKRKKRPIVGEGRKVGSTNMKTRREKTLDRWATPLPTIDPEIVKKSARALPTYGKSFRYGHYLTVGSLPQLAMLGAGVGGAFLVAQVPPGASLLRKLKPSGEGPTDAEREKSRFSVTFVAEADGRKLTTRVSGGDPGYTETSKMVAESATCLALDPNLPETYGVLTTAVAIGTRLIDRLVAAGLKFETIDSGGS